jgi:hypothetical protein
VPLTRLKFRCSSCGSHRTDWVIYRQWRLLFDRGARSTREGECDGHADREPSGAGAPEMRGCAYATIAQIAAEESRAAESMARSLTVLGRFV